MKIRSQGLGAVVRTSAWVVRKIQPQSAENRLTNSEMAINSLRFYNLHISLLESIIHKDFMSKLLILSKP